MGLIYRRRKRIGHNSWLNLSKSGVSGSTRIGPVTMNSRGTGRIRIAKGLSFRFGTKRKPAKPAATFYRHPGCEIHHRTLAAAQRCAVKTSPKIRPSKPASSQTARPPAGWYPCGSDPAGSVRYWDGRAWTAGFKP